MLTQINNRHHSPLPPVGTICRIALSRSGIVTHPGHWRVIAYPLNDNIAPYSYGIHTCYVQRVGGRAVMRLAWQWLRVDE